MARVVFSAFTMKKKPLACAKHEDGSGYRLPTIGYGPNLEFSVMQAIQRSGGMVTTDKNLLIEVVRPDF